MDQIKRKILEKIIGSRRLKYFSFVLVVFLLIYIPFENLEFSYFIYPSLLFFNVILVISSSVNSSSKKVYYKKYLNKEYKEIFLRHFIVALILFLLAFFIFNEFSLVISLKELSILVSLVSLGSFAWDEIYHSLFSL